MSFFNVTSALNYLGVLETFTLYHVSSVVSDDRGDAIKTFIEYALSGSVQVSSGTDYWAKEGNIPVGDLLIFVSDTHEYAGYLTNGDELVWDSKRYRLMEVVKNPGHYECTAARL